MYQLKSNEKIQTQSIEIISTDSYKLSQLKSIQQMQAQSSSVYQLKSNEKIQTQSIEIKSIHASPVKFYISIEIK